MRRTVVVTQPDEKERAPYPRERLVDGARVRVETGGLAWLRRDGGATLLVRGPAELVAYAGSVKVVSGRVFVDTPTGPATELDTPAGKLQLARVRASLDVQANGRTDAHVLDGEVRVSDAVRAQPGEHLILAPGAQPKIEPTAVWEDWTGGLATTDRAAAPAPFGIGTVGARPPGDLGAPRFPLAIQQLDVRVKIDGDFAVTEVDQRFFNPSSKQVEGIYRFRAPAGASIHRFGVDRDGEMVWGRVKESAAAAAQYQSNVYQGSTEDPALLEWEAPGVYRARLYPIGAGETRHVVIRYTEWLGRTGENGERRLYVYPMAAEGSEASLPHIEELTITIDLARAAAKDVRVGMAGIRKGGDLIVRAQDFVPRADLAVELYDDGVKSLSAYYAKHQPDTEVLAPEARAEANAAALKEADYLLVPLRARDIPSPQGGLDLAIVVDSSAANDDASMALARVATLGLLSHLGDDDRAAVWAGAETLQPILPDVKALGKVDARLRRRYSAALATLERGGATDLGAMITGAAAALDPKRRGVIVYLGDGHATVGELGLRELEERIAKLAHPPRVFALGVGRDVDMGILQGLADGGFAARIDDAYSAARTSLEVLEVAERPAWVGTEVDLGSTVERVYPRKVRSILADETVLVMGRLLGGVPARAVIRSPEGQRELSLVPRQPQDLGDLRRRWALARLDELLSTNAGRAAMVDVGTRYGVITPVTSYYVPTRRELDEERRARAMRDELEQEREGEEQRADDKEGGTGVRAKGEEGSMGTPGSKSRSARYAVKGPADNVDPHVAPQNAPAPQASEPAKGAPAASPTTAARPKPAPDSEAAPMEKKVSGKLDSSSTTEAWRKEESIGDDKAKAGNAWGSEIGDAMGAGGLGLADVGEGGGGTGEGIGLAQMGTLGHGAGTGTGQGFGSGHGWLGVANESVAANVRPGATQVAGKLPAEVVQRIVRQNVGRFRLCYEEGLGRNPNLQGKVQVRFAIGADGAVQNVGDAGSDLPDSGVVSCVVSAFSRLSFPQPEGGTVTVLYPILLSPGGKKTAEAGSSGPPPAAWLAVDVLPRVVLRCSPAADLPLAERVVLWRERLARFAGNAAGVLDVYRRALADCEAPSWVERRRLLGMMLDALPSVPSQVTLWRMLRGDSAAADTIYRGIVARVKTAEQMKQLHAALGLRSMDPGLLEKLIQAAKSPAELVGKLRALTREWPDDFALALALLDALEDAEDLAGARELAERLRARPDVDAHVRTWVGELLLRIAAQETDEAKKAAGVEAARRAFGEIVEFSPDDPVARRRLGDLLRAHGWYADARRQYETLATLTPDDPAVWLLMAAAAEGEGQLEAAVRWTEKGRGAGAPDVDIGPAGTARAFAATFLAWGRLSAREGHRDDELAALVQRGTTLLASDQAKTGGMARVTLTWSHPELHPVLYSNALGSIMPAPEGDVTLGIAQVRVPNKNESIVEVRIEPAELAAAARLGAKMYLTIVKDELAAAETIQRIELRFERSGPATLRYSFASGEVSHG